MTTNQILEKSTELREEADEIVRLLLDQTHIKDAAMALFFRHEKRSRLCQLRSLLADLDTLAEAAVLAGHEEGYAEGESETRARFEADRHEPVADWETRP